MIRVNERGEVNKADPSNLPYLHKCPAVWASKFLLILIRFAFKYLKFAKSFEYV